MSTLSVITESTLWSASHFYGSVLFMFHAVISGSTESNWKLFLTDHVLAAFVIELAIGLNLDQLGLLRHSSSKTRRLKPEFLGS